MKLHTKILLGLITGLVIGATTNLTVGVDNATVKWINTYIAGPVGQIFLRMLFMVVIPLVFSSIALGVAGVGDVRKLGRMGGRTLAYFVGTTVIAATLGLIVVNIMQPWERVTPETRVELMDRFSSAAAGRVEAAQTTAKFGPDTFVNIVPRNPVDAAAKTDLLAIIFFGLMFGAALTLIPAAKSKPMIDVLESLSEVVIKIISFAMALAPYGVACLIFTVSSEFGVELLIAVAAFVVTVLVALFLHVSVVISAIVRFGLGLSPLVFFSRIKAVMVTAFSTSSSNATLPTSLNVNETMLGVPRQYGGFVMPLGATMCMNGTSIFEGITVIFLAEIFGVDLTLGQMAIVMVMAVVTAIGAAGVPGGSIPLLVGILVMFGVPGEAIAIVLGVDRILDMSRTTVNVTTDQVIAALIAKSEGAWSAKDLPVLK